MDAPAYGGEHTLALFRSMCSVCLARDWLTFQNRVVSSIPRTSWLVNYLQTWSRYLQLSLSTEPFNADLCAHLIHHPIEAQTFPEPILYLASLAGSWEEAPMKHALFVNGDGSLGPNNQKVIEVHEEGTPFKEANPGVTSRVVQRRSITEASHEEESSSKRKQVVGSGSGSVQLKLRRGRKGKSKGNILSLTALGSVPKGVVKHVRAVAHELGLEGVGDNDPFFPSHYSSLNNKRLEELVNYDDVEALHLSIAYNMMNNEA
ncbi:hypothetical protein Tco_1288773 [Tanacetum coccineum]